MPRRVVLAFLFELLSVSMVVGAFNIRPVGAIGTIYIQADGSIDPPTAPIYTADNITYTLTGNVTSDADGVHIERDDIVFDGAGYTLQGAGSGTGISGGSGSGGSDNVTMRDTKIKGFALGIRLFNFYGSVISGNTITSNAEGIKVFGWEQTASFSNVISGNTITNNENGTILVDHAWDNILLGNVIANNSNYGIALIPDEAAFPLIGENMISRNTITNNGIGVFLSSFSNNVISENNITGGYSNIWLQWSSNNIISGNNIDTGAVGLDFSYSSNYNTISGNNITNLEYGLSFGYSCNYNTVSGNNIRANTQYAVCLDSSSNNTFSQNNVMNNGQGVYLSNGCRNNTFSGNNIANQYSGILIESDNLPSNYNSISGNTIANNTHGIDIYYSHNSTVSGNTVTNNTYGIFLLGSGNGTFSGNTVTNNTYGIALDTSFNNIIYHNNFIDNSQQVFCYESTNVWDDGYPSGGNYWSDYAGVDADGDGIGDSPRVIDVSNKDNYPLMNPYIAGDADHDGDVDYGDFIVLAGAYGSHSGQPAYKRNVDFDLDNDVDYGDFILLAGNYGKHM